ncbi:bifunctional endoribonuclease/protein kinase ire1 [Coemansia sp. RSA 1591]|nr:bifunctional endoribonuclease/protein kinase ire1 [Coemansia sp. RSA 1591]
MGWLTLAIWELCMSMLPHRNTRALLVPVLCIALLVPFAAAATATTPAYSKPRSRGVVFLGRDSSGIVPRKFTIPEPSVVAVAEHKHIAMLPSRPFAAAAYEHRLLKRNMLERSGVSLVDTMVVVTVDGRMYGVSRHDGSIVWNRECLFETAESTCPRSLVRTKGQSRNAKLKDEDGSELDLDNEEEWLLEQGIDWKSDSQVLERQRQLRREWLGSTDSSTDNHGTMYIAEPGGGGALYVYSPEVGLKRLPLTVANLVDQSPVQVQGVLYTGTKEASFAAIDAASGQLLSVYGDERTREHGSQHSTNAPVRLLLGEKLDRVRIYPASGSTSSYSHEPQWELYHRSVNAPSLDPEIDSLLSELSDAVEALGTGAVPPTSDGTTVSRGPTKFVMTQDGGFVMVEAATGIPLWAQEFDAPVASVFDVFGIADPESDLDRVEYVARKRELSPAAQHSRYMRWRRLHETDDEVLAREHIGFSSGRGSNWRTGSAGGNILAGPFWERLGKADALPQIAYIGKLKDTLYTLTGDEFPLIDHAALTSSLLLALVQAKHNQDRYPEMQTVEWWNRWNFLTHDAIVLRVLQEARAWWLKPAASEGGLALENHFERLMDIVKAAQPDDRCYPSTIIGIHPLERQQSTSIPELEGEPLNRLALPGPGALRDSYNDNYGAADSDQDEAGTMNTEDWPWWRYVGHYMTRVAAFIGYAVTIAVLVAFVGAIYLLRPRSKRRPRMWIDAAGDDTNAPGRRARLRISWALMHRMWDTLKYEWKAAIDEAWRNPNAAAVLRRTGVYHRTPPKSDESSASSPLENSRQSSASSNGSFYAPRRGSTSLSGLGLLGREDSEPSSFERIPSGMSTPRRNSTGTLPMTPLKRASLEGDSLQHHVRLGAITLSDQVLGYGSHGTVVYRGEFQGRAVAVKRLLLDFYEVADHEVQVLQESDSHPNVIRYFCTERQDHFMYIALELCCGSLADAVLGAPKAKLANQLLVSMPKKKILHQLACGLLHLHALKLVHRDIKPQNILVAPPPHRRRRRRKQPNSSESAPPEGIEPLESTFEDSNIVAGGAPRVLISDFGLSRILDDDESSFANTYTMHGAATAIPGFAGGLPPGMLGGMGGGTVGWRAPECFDSPEARMSLENASTSLSSADHIAESPSWSLINGGALAEEPSPYVSRGTRSRMRSLAMTQTSRPVEGEDPDSTDRAGSSSIPLTAGTGSRRRMTRAVDIFSMGCVFYYVLMGGEHPFGDRLSREQRILSGVSDLRALESSDNISGIDAVDLIAHMVARAERDRPSAASVLAHPYFWDATQRLGFLQDVSDCLEAEARLIKAAREDMPEPPKKTKAPKKKGGVEKTGAHAISNESIEDIILRLPAEQATAVRRAITLLDMFEVNSTFVMEAAPPPADGFQVVGMPPNHSAAVEAMGEAVGPSKPRRVAWDRRLDPHLRRDLGKFRKYDGTRLRDLLRIIRNKKNHYQDMPPPLRDALGDIPDGYLDYFESRFPYLLLHCYYFVLEDDSLRTATVFRPYFRAPSL